MNNEGTTCNYVITNVVYWEKDSLGQWKYTFSSVDKTPTDAPFAVAEESFDTLRVKSATTDVNNRNDGNKAVDIYAAIWDLVIERRGKTNEGESEKTEPLLIKNSSWSRYTLKDSSYCIWLFQRTHKFQSFAKSGWLETSFWVGMTKPFFELAFCANVFTP